jgi:hypothetical protein
MVTRAGAQGESIIQDAMPKRRWDIDWLRVLAVVGLLVPYHTYRVFDIWDDW